MKKNKLIIILPVLLIVVGVIIFQVYFHRDFDFAGTVEATRIDIPARVSTTVSELLVEEGQQVKKNQIIAKLSCEDIIITNRLDTDNYNRAIKLQKSESISKESFDLILNKKQDSDTRLSWCEIKSPVNGTILTKFLETSEWVNPGTKVVTVADLTNLWTYFYVPQEIMSKVKLGMKIQGKVVEIGKSFEGEVIKINDEAEFTPKNVQTQSERTRLVFGIKVQFKNMISELKPGMTIVSNLNQ